MGGPGSGPQGGRLSSKEKANALSLKADKATADANAKYKATHASGRFDQDARAKKADAAHEKAAEHHYAAAEAHREAGNEKTADSHERQAQAHEGPSTREGPVLSRERADEEHAESKFTAHDKTQYEMNQGKSNKGESTPEGAAKIKAEVATQTANKATSEARSAGTPEAHEKAAEAHKSAAWAHADVDSHRIERTGKLTGPSVADRHHEKMADTHREHASEIRQRNATKGVGKYWNS